MKRTISLVLALILILGSFSGIPLTAHAASYSYNSGVRDKVCTALSSDAKSYYVGSYSYAQLSALSGSSLRTKLRSLITSNRKTVGYNGLKTYFPYTDAYEGSSSKLRLFYCDGTTTSKWDSAKTWNREHMWPDSKGGSAMEGDLHAMRPTDPNTNSTRGNNKYGNVSGGKTAYTNEANGSLPGGTYGNSTFEPLDFSKGDCARVILYDYVVASSMSSVTEVFTDVNTLLDWCASDPVDTYEMSRNDVAQEIQGCRNPFVDFPELAWILLGKAVPQNLTTPSGGQATSYTITASSNNTAYGTVKLQGRVITATPATGCYVEGYKILSGDATVTRDGNNFVVEPKSNCSICILFAKKTEVTVSFRGLADPITGYAETVVTLPTIACDEPYTFVGWVEESVEKTSVKPNYYKAGTGYTLTKNVEFYPLYTISEGGTGTGLWTLAETDAVIRVGTQVVIAHGEKGVVAGDVYKTYLEPVDAQFSSDYETIEVLPAGASVFTVGGQKDAWTLTDGSGRSLGCSDAKTVGWGIGTLTWKILISEDGADIFSTISTYGRILYNISAPRFTTYTGNPATHLPRPQLYIMDGTGGTVYYTSEIGSCKHSYEAQITEATCKEDGYTTYTCSLCGDTYVDDPTMALGHDWDEGTVTLFPTVTETGIKTYTCLRCEETKTESIPVIEESEHDGCSYGDHCGSLTFTDMPVYGNWAHEGIDFVVTRELFNGMSKDTFAPDKTMTRAMLVTVLWRCAGEPEAQWAEFSDVSIDLWYSKAVAWGAEEGVITGYTDGTFRPDNQITREQLATILFRFARLMEMDPEERVELDAFPDAQKVQSYAKEALCWAVAKGLVNGVYHSSTGETFLRPDNSATRAQVATILMRFLQEVSEN